MSVSKDRPIAVFGSTLYHDPTDQRFLSCCRFLEAAKAIGLPVFLGDASPNPTVAAHLVSRATGVVHLPPIAPMEVQKAAAMELAWGSGAKYLAHTELEKDDLVNFFSAVPSTMEKADAVMTIPCRSAKSWESFPVEMREIEGFALDLVEKLTGFRWDLVFGPFAVHRDMYTSYFRECRSSKWEWLHRPRLEIINAYSHHANGVISVSSDFCYPVSQKNAEEGNRAFLVKRITQLQYLTNPLTDIFDSP